MKALGIDIGGTGIKAGIVNTSTGKILGKRYRIPTPRPATPEALLLVCKEIIEHFKYEGPVGCGFPGVVQNETIFNAPNLDGVWAGINFGRDLQTETGCPTYLINDADAAALAEVRFGAGKGQAGTLLVLTVGTGIGTAIFRDGVLIPNVEMGHIRLDNGMIGETWASGIVLQRDGLEWEEWTKRFNSYLQTIHALLWPDLIIIGGGVANDAHLFFRYLNVPTTIVPAKLLNPAGIIGAAYKAAVAWENRQASANSSNPE